MNRSPAIANWFRKAEVSSICALFSSLGAAAHELGAQDWPTTVSGVFLVAFIILEWPKLIWAARALVLASLLAFVVFSSLGGVSVDLLETAVNRAAFLVYFVVSLAVLRDAAQTSRLVRTCGQIVVNQSPGRRYTTLAIGSHVMGVLLNLGTVNLLATMVRRSVDNGQKAVDPAIRELRLQRMSLAVLRGFCTVPLWAPTSVTIAIVLSSSLGLTWFDLLPLGIPATIIYLILGWAFDRLTNPRGRLASEVVKSEPALKPFASLLGIVLLVPVLAYYVAGYLHLPLISALLMCVPFIAVIWIAIQYKKAGSQGAPILTLRHLKTRTLPAFSEMRNEIIIFASSGFMGILLLPQINIDLLSYLISQYGLTAGWVLVLSSWAIVVPALFGINPLVTAILALETLPRLSGLDFQPVHIAFMITVTWSGVVGLSPLTTSVRLIARCINRDPFQVGMVWNLSFSICVLLGLDAFLLIAA